VAPDGVCLAVGVAARDDRRGDRLEAPSYVATSTILITNQQIPKDFVRSTGGETARQHHRE
jgi:hypothetical protein